MCSGSQGYDWYQAMLWLSKEWFLTTEALLCWSALYSVKIILMKSADAASRSILYFQLISFNNVQHQINRVSRILSDITKSWSSRTIFQYIQSLRMPFKVCIYWFHNLFGIFLLLSCCKACKPHTCMQATHMHAHQMNFSLSSSSQGECVDPHICIFHRDAAPVLSGSVFCTWQPCSKVALLIPLQMDGRELNRVIST